MSSSEVKNFGAVSNEEVGQISRILLAWLNQFPEKPVNIVNYEFLSADKPGMALSTIQTAFKTKKYILGGYEAQYQFKVIYRVQPGNSNDKRLKADELLNALGSWAANRKDLPVLGPGKRVKQIEFTMQSSLFAQYENGSEDHQIFFNMNYEVI